MRITNKGEYGLRVAMRLARNYHTGTSMTTREIAEAEHLSEEYVQKLLWELLHAGIIESRRGAKGGFVLTKPPRETTARQIVWALEGGIFEVACLRFMEGEKRCMYLDLHDCGLRALWVSIYKKVNELLTEANLELLIQKEDKVKERLASFSRRRVIPIATVPVV